MMTLRIFARFAKGIATELPEAYPTIVEMLSTQDLQKNIKDQAVEKATELGLTTDINWAPISRLLYVNLLRTFPDSFTHADTADHLERLTFETIQGSFALQREHPSPVANLMKYASLLNADQLGKIKALSLTTALHAKMSLALEK
jgi:hypothetical protein